MKTAFVYNFAVFTEWPADALRDSEGINVCIDSYSPMAQPLATLNGKYVKHKRLSLRRLDLAHGDLSSCHILYVDHKDRGNWMSIKKKINSASVLTITDDPEAGANGAIIALALRSDKIVFEVDMASAQKARLVMSSKLLRLAKAVK